MLHTAYSVIAYLLADLILNVYNKHHILYTFLHMKQHTNVSQCKFENEPDVAMHTDVDV